MVFNSCKIALACQNSYILCVRALVFCKKFFLEHYDKLLKNSLCRVTNVKTDDNQFLQAVLAAAKVRFGDSSTRLHLLPAFLASAVGAKNALSEIIGLEHVDGTYDDALKGWFEKLIWLRKMKSRILRLEPTDVKRINAFQDRFGSQCLNVIPCKNLK